MKKSQLFYRVPYADTDQMGVVYYANFLVYFERVRNEILRDINYSYIDMEKNGLLLPVIEAHCEYSVPAKYDDYLEILGWFGENKGCRIKVFCEVMRNNTLLASGYTIHVCLSAVSLKPIRIPEEIT